MKVLIDDLLALAKCRLSKSQRAMMAARFMAPMTELKRCRVIYRALEMNAQAKDRRRAR